MVWIDRKDEWFENRKASKAHKELERSYSISEVAALLSVSRHTVYKWLSLDELDDAVIPPSGWFRLPNRYIRIRQWAVEKLMEG